MSGAKTTGAAASGRPAVQRATKQPPGTRIPLVRKVEDLDDRPYLTDEDKAIGREAIEWFEQNYYASLTNTAGMWMNDPKYAKAYHFDFHGKVMELCTELQAEPEKTGSYVMPYCVMNLLFLSVAKHHHWTWAMGSQAMIMPHVEGFDPERVFMLDFPEAEVWNDEQRLALIFAKAVMTRGVTDELMAEALKMWGVKLTIRYIGLIGSLTSQALFMSAFNVAGRWNDAPGAESICSDDPMRAWDLEKTLEPAE